MKKTKTSRDGAIALLLAGLFILIVALVSIEFQESPGDVGLNPANEVRAIDLVNKHLREVYDRQEIDRKNAENMNALTAPPLYKAPRVEPRFNFDELPISFDQDSIDELVGQDLARFTTGRVSARSLNEQIQQEVINDINAATEQEISKKALADAIIQKARKQGLDVQIDENFKIKSVRKINLKEAPSVFDPNSLPNR
jgi:hypothetical protein